MYTFTLWQVLNILILIFYGIISTIIYIRDPGSKLGRSALLIAASFMAWTLGLTIAYNPETPYFVAALSHNLAALGWITFPSLALWFTMIFTENKNILRKTAFKLAVIIVPAVFIILYFAGMIMNNPVKSSFGWYVSWKKGLIFPYLYFFYLLSFVLYANYKMFKYYRRTDNYFKKGQAGTLLLFTLLSVMTGFVIEIIIPLLDNGKENVTIFDLTNIYLVLWLFGIFYAVLRYRLIKITPSSAAENIVENMAEAVFLLDDEMNILYVNSSALNIFGISKEELLGKPFCSFIAEGSSISAPLKEALKKGTSKNHEIVMRTAAGRRVITIMSMATIKEHGYVAGLACVITDITQRKITEQKLEENYKKLKELDHLKSNFISMVSHELRTPLTSIKGFLSFLTHGMAGPVTTAQLEYLSIINTNTGRLLKLINDLLDISKIESGNFSISRKKTGALGILRDTIRDFRPLAAQKSITIKLEEPEKNITVNVDEFRISQSIGNLLNNSVKFSGKNSAITIGLKEAGQKEIKSFERYYKTSFPGKGKYALLYIKDPGTGVEKDKIKKIFNRFYQAEDTIARKTDGTGLGLNIAKSIIEKHNGYIWAESEGINKGTSFFIMLPEPA